MLRRGVATGCDLTARMWSTGFVLKSKILLRAQAKRETTVFLNELGICTYETCALKLSQIEVVFAFQTKGMTTDFLAALRNDAREKGYVIVSLTTERSDTVDSATRLLSDPGMPFSGDLLKSSVKEVILSSGFTSGEKALLDFGLKHMEEDRFSDKSSISGYEPFLRIIERAKVVTDDFWAFGMFPDCEALNLCSRVNDKKTRERFEDNANCFQTIEKAMAGNDVKEMLGEVYTKSFVDLLQRKKTLDEDWYAGLTYGSVVDSKKKNPDDTIVELSEDFKVEFKGKNDPSFGFLGEHDAYMRFAGDTKAKRRTRHILVFVSRDVTEITLKFRTSSPVLKSHICSHSDNVEIDRRQSMVRVVIRLCDEVTFADAKIQKNDLHIAVLPVREKYFSSIESRFSVNVKKQSILVDVENGSFCLNPAGEETDSVAVSGGGQYSCYDNTCLELSIGEEDLNDTPSIVRFFVSCDECRVPFSVKLDNRAIRRIDAAGVYKEKLISRQSFKRLPSDRIQMRSREYILDDPLFVVKLDIEKKMLDAHCLSMERRNGELHPRHLDLPERLRSAYASLMDLLLEEGVEPSLAFAGDERFREAFRNCLESYREAVFEIENGSFGFEVLLEIGVIFAEEEGEIWFTPLHPLNIAYQINLANQISDIEEDDKLVDAAFARLVHSQAVPLIYHSDKYFEASNEIDALEWCTYYESNSKKGRMRGDRTSRIVRERIKDFLNHFGVLFVGAPRKPLRIACYWLGTCDDILVGIAEYYFAKLMDKKQDPDRVIDIHVDCYGDLAIYTAFENLLNRETLVLFLKAKGLMEKGLSPAVEHERVSTLLQHLSFSLHDGTSAPLYSHIAFVPGASRVNIRSDGDPHEIRTGIMLEGAICASSTTDVKGWFSTAFGSRDLVKNDFGELLQKANALYASAYSQKGASDGVITAAVSRDEEEGYDSIYMASTWVVLLDPRVDPVHFVKEGAGEDRPLVIHYEDRESSSGYDAITVTKKTEQYEGVINEALIGASHGIVKKEHVRAIINFANAFNGTWLLSFLDPRNVNMPRSRMSMLAAVKAGMAHYANKDIVWVPVSLEETLRVSRGLRLSAATEINSWKNLGFESEPTSDDILLIGVLGDPANPKVVLHPIEVKVGNCTRAEIDKGVRQAGKTYDGFMSRYWGEEYRERLTTRIARNSFMQKMLVSAEKMRAYGIFPGSRWEFVLDDCRAALQNEHYDIVESSYCNMPHGTVCAFGTDVAHAQIETNGYIRVLRLPEMRIPEVTIGSEEEVLGIAGAYDFDRHFQPSSQMEDDFANEVNTGSNIGPNNQPARGGFAQFDISTGLEKVGESVLLPEVDGSDSAAKKRVGVSVLFGKNLSTGEDLVWEPCDTSKLFHANTGIIGTMGTGKTQFTKSLITQLHRDQGRNLQGLPIGILIFDYKGDYNESKVDFVEETAAKILKPYRLPFNPLSLTKSTTFKPLLPIHVANSFKDTLARIYSLGPKQQDALFQCILDAYHRVGIWEDKQDSWDIAAPTFESVYQAYANNDEIKKNDSLAAAMNKLHSFQVFESVPGETKSLYELLRGVVVIDLSGYDPDIQNLVVAITLDLFYLQMQASGSSRLEGKYRQLTKMILVDEADNFMSQGFPVLKKILKEGREFGVGTILSTQFLRHFQSKEEDYSKYILTWVVHNVADLDASGVRFVFGTKAKSPEEDYLIEQVKRLGKHCSVVKIGEMEKPVVMRDKAFFELLLDAGGEA